MSEAADARRYERLMEHFTQLQGQPAAARASALRKLHSTDPDLANELSELLDIDDGDDGELTSGADLLGGIAAQVMAPAADTAPSMPAIGECVNDRYRVRDLLGQGGMGAVVGAVNVPTGAEVALKFMNAPGSLAPHAGERFEREARIGGTQRHPNVVRVFDVGECQYGRYLVMERLYGRSLAEHLAGGPLAVDEAVRIALGVARGIGHAHQLGIVHRDLKPGNVFLADEPDAEQPVPKVLDFGISRTLHSEEPLRTLTGKGGVIGTPTYMPLEQLRGERVDYRADVYALGAILFEMIVGKPPFDSTYAHDRTARMATEAAPSLTALQPGVPPALARLVSRALARDPDQRPADGKAMASALQALVDGGVASRPTRGAKGWVLSGLAALALAGAGLAFAAMPEEPPPTAPGAESPRAGTLARPVTPEQVSPGAAPAAPPAASQDVPSPTPVPPVAKAPAQDERPQGTPTPARSRRPSRRARPRKRPTPEPRPRPTVDPPAAAAEVKKPAGTPSRVLEFQLDDFGPKGE